MKKYWHAEFRADFVIKHYNQKLAEFQAKSAVNLKLNPISLAQMNKKFEQFAKINFTAISMNFHKPTFDFTGSERVEMLLRIHRLGLQNFPHDAASSSDIDGDLMDQIQEKLHIEGKLNCFSQTNQFLIII